jgi:hypothetical protein
MARKKRGKDKADYLVTVNVRARVKGARSADEARWTAFVTMKHLMPKLTNVKISDCEVLSVMAISGPLPEEE